MATIIGSFLTFLLLYKYQALFSITVVAAFLLPLPASTTIAAAGAFASQGYLNLPLVLLVAFLGNVLGDAAGYLIARRYGIPVLKKIGFERLMRSHRYHMLQDYILNFPQSLIYVTRFLTQAGPAVNILAGIAGVPYRQFFLYDVLGEASYVLLYAFAGYFLGTQWEANLSFASKGAFVVISIGLVILLIQAMLYRRNRKKLVR